MARPFSPATTLPISSISSKSGAEGETSPPVSDEDGLSYPELELDESESSVSVEDEFESSVSDVSGLCSLISMSNGAESSVPVSDGPESSVSESDELELSDSEESESLSLSVRSGGDSEPARGVSTGTMPLVDRSATLGGTSQSPRRRPGLPSHTWLSLWMAVRTCSSHGRLSVGGRSC